MATKQMPWQLNKCHIKKDQPIKYDQMSFGPHPKEPSCDAWLLIFPVIKKGISQYIHTQMYIFIFMMGYIEYNIESIISASKSIFRDR